MIEKAENIRVVSFIQFRINMILLNQRMKFVFIGYTFLEKSESLIFISNSIWSRRKVCKQKAECQATQLLGL